MLDNSQIWAHVNGAMWVIYPVMPFMDEKNATFGSASDTALGCILTRLSDQLYDVYMNYTNPPNLWDARERKYVVSDTCLLL